MLLERLSKVAIKKDGDNFFSDVLPTMIILSLTTTDISGKSDEKKVYKIDNKTGDYISH